MKQKIINTSKAEILVVELPRGGHSAEIYHQKMNSIMFMFYDGNRNIPYVKDIPKGDWQPLIFDEETAEKIVGRYFYNYKPQQKLNQQSLYDMFWVKYPNGHNKHFDTKDECYTHALIMELKSLIDANVLTKNPFGDKEPEFEDTGDIEGDYNYWANKATEWQEAEANVFHNPHYFYKIK